MSDKTKGGQKKYYKTDLTTEIGRFINRHLYLSELKFRKTVTVIFPSNTWFLSSSVNVNDVHFFLFKLCSQAAKLHSSTANNRLPNFTICVVFPWLQNSFLRFNRWMLFNLFQSGERQSSNLYDPKYSSTGPDLKMEKHLLCAGGQKHSLAMLLIV